MASGIGIDLLEIRRLERALRRHPRLAQRVFTDAEPAVRLSGRAAEAAGGERIEVSLTHSREFAAAVAVRG